MPYFRSDIDIEIDEFLSECNSKDINEIIDCLIEDGHILPKQRRFDKSPSSSMMEQDHISMCETLADKFYQMSNEDIQILEIIYKKYR